MKSKIQIYHYDFLRIMKKYSIMGMYFSIQSPSKERATINVLINDIFPVDDKNVKIERKF